MLFSLGSFGAGFMCVASCLCNMDQCNSKTSEWLRIGGRLVADLRVRKFSFNVMFSKRVIYKAAMFVVIVVRC